MIKKLRDTIHMDRKKEAKIISKKLKGGKRKK